MLNILARIYRKYVQSASPVTLLNLEYGITIRLQALTLGTYLISYKHLA